MMILEISLNICDILNDAKFSAKIQVFVQKIVSYLMHVYIESSHVSTYKWLKTYGGETGN